MLMVVTQDVHLQVVFCVILFHYDIMGFVVSVAVS